MRWRQIGFTVLVGLMLVGAPEAPGAGPCGDPQPKPQESVTTPPATKCDSVPAPWRVLGVPVMTEC